MEETPAAGHRDESASKTIIDSHHLIPTGGAL
jgi:hypothetical protein